MPNTYINKVVFGTSTLLDLTNDTITPEDVINNKQFHMADGSITTGVNTYDADTKDATALASEILNGKTAYKNGNKLTGTMPNVGQQIVSVISITTHFPINSGYHDGSGYAKISDTEAAKLLPDNIKKGITILGVEGDLSGDELVSVTTISVTPKVSADTYVPSAYSDTTGQPYDYFAQFTVNAIPYSESDNPAGGKTVTIAGN